MQLRLYRRKTRKELEIISYGNYNLTPWNRIPIRKTIVAQLFKKFTASYITRKFITVSSEKSGTELHSEQVNPIPTLTHPVSFININISVYASLSLSFSTYLSICLPISLSLSIYVFNFVKYWFSIAGEIF